MRSVGRNAINRQHRARPVLRGAKITAFLLGALLTTVLTSGLLTRPTQAEFLNLKEVGCLLNIGVCPPPAEDPDEEIPGEEPAEEPEEPTPSDDATLPTATVNVDPALAGGNTQTVIISGTVADENLASYTLALNGNVVQQANDLEGQSVDVTASWSVTNPNKVPSGMYTITLDAFDDAGNTVRAQVTVEVDNDGPAVKVGGGDVIVRSGSISPSMTAEDVHGVASYQWVAAEGNPAVLEYDVTAKEPTFTPTVEGSYVYTVTVSDGLGNVTPKTFRFDYQRQLETVALPTTKNPADNLVVQNPSIPAAVSNTPTVRSSRDEITSSDDAAVLGNTVMTAGASTPAITTAAIAPTGNGWSIFGLLWYWWLAIIGGLFVAWLLLKKFVVSQIPEDS